MKTRAAFAEAQCECVCVCVCARAALDCDVLKYQMSRVVGKILVSEPDQLGFDSNPHQHCG